MLSPKDSLIDPPSIPEAAAGASERPPLGEAPQEDLIAAGELLATADWVSSAPRSSPSYHSTG